MIISNSSWPIAFCTDHHHLGGGQAGVRAKGRDRRKRLDPLGGGRWTSSGEKTSASAMNINACNLDTLIHTPRASQRCMCGEYIGVWLMNQPDSSRCCGITCVHAVWGAYTLAKCLIKGFFFYFLPLPLKQIIISPHQGLFSNVPPRGWKKQINAFQFLSIPPAPKTKQYDWGMMNY